MRDINLLPQELKPNKSVLLFAAKVRKAGIFAASGLVLIFIFIFALHYYLNNQLIKTRQEIERLQSEIALQEATEQRLILIRDRADKIMNITLRGSIYEEISVAKYLIDSKIDGITIDNFSGDRSLLKTSFSSPSLLSVNQYLDKIVDADVSRVTLVSFDYSPLTGYTIVLNILV